ncbi:E3 SUMO-protein ligase RanBP2-like isoform X2 [Mytilus trossulus]|uniref:E3 SUMO-protein ligase RanBP2-like isoform X2 n=1 Tax=Mytilus trossulus TaxID=6551 RepID=UPI003005E3CE
MAEGVDSSIDILTCPICLERYTKPKYLPCLHTFCEGCILTFIVSVFKKSEGKVNIDCPVCRTTVTLPKEGCTPREWVDQFPGNFLIVGLLDKEKPQKLCMSCERLDIVSQAIFICNDCSDTLCGICQKYHSSNKSTSNHQIKKIFTLPEKEKVHKTCQNICSDHSKKLKLFCNDHNVPCCTLCVSLSHRKCDNVVTFEEAVKTFSTDFKLDKIKTYIRDVSNDCDNLISHYVECLQSNDRQYDKEHKEIEETCDYIISQVKATEKLKKDELTKMHDEKQHILKHRLETCQILTTVVSDKLTEINHEKGSEIQRLIMAYAIEDEIKQHKDILKTYREDEHKLLIHVEKVLPKDIDMLMNSLCTVSWGSNVESPTLLTPKSSPGFNLERDISFSKSINDSGIGATVSSAADVQIGQTPTTPDKRTLDTGRRFTIGGQISTSAIKITSDGTGTTKPPFSGGFRLENLPEAVKYKPTPGAVSFGQTVSPISDMKIETPEYIKKVSDSEVNSGFKFCTPDSTRLKSDSDADSGFYFLPLDSFKYKSDSEADSRFKFYISEYTKKKSDSEANSGFKFPTPDSTKYKSDSGANSGFKFYTSEYMKTKSDSDANSGFTFPTPDSTKNKSDSKADSGFTFSTPGSTKNKSDSKANSGFTFPTLDSTKNKSDSKANSGFTFPTQDSIKYKSDSGANSGFKFYTPESTKNKSDSRADSGFTFTTPDSTKDKSDSKADSGFRFPTPDSTKDKSLYETASGFRFSTPASIMDNQKLKPSLCGQTSTPGVEKNKQDTRAKGFNYILKPPTLPDNSRRGLNFTLSSSEDDSTGPKYLSTEPGGGEDTKTSNFNTCAFGQNRSSDLPKLEYDFRKLGPTLTGNSSSEMREEVFNLVATGFSFSSIANKFLETLGGIFGEGRIFSFSELAKEADSSTSTGFKVQDHNEQFRWKGAGQQLFSTDPGDGYNEDTDESGAIYDYHYKPIIALPDLVDVKTGEEDYETMFCQRARLYRFHKETNQWKEKGLGAMKILRHHVNSRYRLILRRQIVLKLACNQWLTTEMSFKVLPTSETSWFWVGQDFSDSPPVIELLAIKFQTIELAQQFKQKIDSCQSDMRGQSSASNGKDVAILPTTVISQIKESKPGVINLDEPRTVVTQRKKSRHVITLPKDSRTFETRSEESHTMVPQPAESHSVVLQPEELHIVVSQPEESKVDITKKDVSVEEEGDEDENSTDEDETLVTLFDKRIKFFSKEVGWKALGLGTMKVFLDGNGYLVKVELDNNNSVCHHLVAKEQNVYLNNKDCLWSPIDYSTFVPVRRHFKAKFRSKHAANKFQKLFEEGQYFAEEYNISERDMVPSQT